MRTSVERKAERKAAAIAWQKKNSEPSRRANAYAFRNDDPAEKIPMHGRRGKGRPLRLDKSALQAVKTSKTFSTRLVTGASVALFWKRAEQIVGQDVSDKPGALPVVLDSNVVVAGLLASKNGYEVSRRLMELALNGGEVVPLVTWSIIEEYQRVCLGHGDRNFNLLCQLLSRSKLVSPSPAVVVPEVDEDPSDTPFLEALALSMRGLIDDERPAPRLVTWDHHLLDMAAVEELDASLRRRIVTPADLLRELKR